MEQKAIGVLVMFLVLSVGVISVLKLSEDTSGATIVEPRTNRASKYCCCDFKHFNYRGEEIVNAAGGQNWVRIKSSQHSDDACDMRCHAYYGRSNKEIVGTMC